MKRSIFVALLALPLLSLCQVRIGAATGVVATETGPRINGILIVGYELKSGLSVQADMRAALFQNASFFGLNAGYNIPVGEDSYFRPYAGYWLRKTGKQAQDRFVSGNDTTFISKTLDKIELPGHAIGWGVQFIRGPLFIDAGYVNQWQVSFGVSFKFGQHE